MKREALLIMVGEFYLEHTRKLGHDELLRNLGENMLAFLENLDYMHTYMMSDYPDANMPSFRCEATSLPDRITLHYYSFRQDLYPVVVGRSLKRGFITALINSALGVFPLPQVLRF